MLEPLKAALPNSHLVATTVPGTPNSLPPEELAAAWGANSTPIADTDAAFAGTTLAGAPGAAPDDEESGGSLLVMAAPPCGAARRGSRASRGSVC